MRSNLVAALSVVLVSGGVNATHAGEITYEVSFTNVTHGVILTPPIFTLSEHKLSVSEVGKPASLGLQMVAEGGSTDELRAELESQGIQDVVQMGMPVMPGVTGNTGSPVCIRTEPIVEPPKPSRTLPGQPWKSIW